MSWILFRRAPFSNEFCGDGLNGLERPRDHGCRLRIEKAFLLKQPNQALLHVKKAWIVRRAEEVEKHEIVVAR